MQLDIGATPFRRGAPVGFRDEATAALEAAWADWKMWAGLCDADTIKEVGTLIDEPTALILS